MVKVMCSSVLEDGEFEFESKENHAANDAGFEPAFGVEPIDDEDVVEDPDDDEEDPDDFDDDEDDDEEEDDDFDDDLEDDDDLD